MIHQDTYPRGKNTKNDRKPHRSRAACVSRVCPGSPRCPRVSRVCPVCAPAPPGGKLVTAYLLCRSAAPDGPLLVLLRPTWLRCPLALARSSVC